MYDVYTPIVADADVEISFEEAKKTALEALAVLGKDYTDVLEEAFSNRWLDVYENTGKRGRRLLHRQRLAPPLRAAQPQG